MSLRFIGAAAKQLRVATLVTAVAVIGAGGAAAVTVTNVADSGSTPTVTATADPTESPEASETSDPQESSEASETPDATGTDSPDPTSTATSDPTSTATSDPTTTAPAPLDPIACLAAVNHGEYVSHIAHMTQGDPDHGALVAAAAQSDCGKSDATAAPTPAPTDTTTPTDTATPTDSATATATASAATVRSGHGHHVKSHTRTTHRHGRSHHRG